MADFTLDQQRYTITTPDDAHAVIVLPQADLGRDAAQEAVGLIQPLPFFVKQTTQFAAEQMQITYDVAGLRTFDKIIGLPLTRRLAIAQRVLVVQKLINTPFTTVLHPDNLRFTPTDDVRLLYRGILGQLPPKQFDPGVLMNQVKALLMVLVDGKGDFVALYEGNGRIAQGRMSKAIANAKTYDDLDKILTDELKAVQKDEKAHQRTVPRVRYRVFQQLAIWMSVVAVVSLIAVGYWLFSVRPFQDRLQEANTAYLKSDYSGVQDALKPIKIDKLPATQRFELSRSYVQTASLKKSQRQNILKNLSINSEKDYVNFWIESGRGNLDKALDLAKRTEESDLILYAIDQQISATKEDTKMSGDDREKKLDDLQKQYDTYEEERNKALGKDDEDKKDTADEDTKADDDGKKETTDKNAKDDKNNKDEKTDKK